MGQPEPQPYSKPADAAAINSSKVFAESLPLDWNHFPADATEGWEMLCRAKARYDRLERELAALRAGRFSSQPTGEAAALQRTGPSEEARKLHDLLGGMIDQVGHPDFSLRELVNGLRGIRDGLLRLAGDKP